MKKLLSILASVGIVATSSTATIACGSSTTKNNNQDLPNIEPQYYNGKDHNNMIGFKWDMLNMDQIINNQSLADWSVDLLCPNLEHEILAIESVKDNLGIVTLTLKDPFQPTLFGSYTATITNKKIDFNDKVSFESETIQLPIKNASIKKGPNNYMIVDISMKNAIVNLNEECLFYVDTSKDYESISFQQEAVLKPMSNSNDGLNFKYKVVSKNSDIPASSYKSDDEIILIAILKNSPHKWCEVQNAKVSNLISQNAKNQYGILSATVTGSNDGASTLSVVFDHSFDPNDWIKKNSVILHAKNAPRNNTISMSNFTSSVNESNQEIITFSFENNGDVQGTDGPFSGDDLSIIISSNGQDEELKSVNVANEIKNVYPSFDYGSFNISGSNSQSITLTGKYIYVFGKDAHPALTLRKKDDSSTLVKGKITDVDIIDDNHIMVKFSFTSEDNGTYKLQGPVGTSSASGWTSWSYSSADLTVSIK